MHHIANISQEATRLFKPHGVGVAHRPAGTLRSRLMKIKDRVDPSDQFSTIYKAQCKVLSHTNNWVARLFKEAWLGNDFQSVNA